MALFVVWASKPGRSRAPLDVLNDRRRIAQALPTDQTTPQATRIGPYHVATFPTRSPLYEADEQVHSDPMERLCAIHGSLWRSAGGRPSILKAEQIGTDTQIGTYSGSYSAMRATRGGVVAFNDQEALYRVYIYDDEDLVAISNSAPMLAALARRQEVDPVSMAWLTAVGYGFGERTPFASVKAVPQGSYVRIDGTESRIEPIPAHPLFFRRPRHAYQPGDFDDDLDEGIDQAKAALLIAAGDKPQIDLAITGGKDSRVVLALCLAAGLKDRLRLFTTGFADHPDVVVGKLVAETTGLPHKTQEPSQTGTPPIWSADETLSYIRRFTAISSGALGAWDLQFPEVGSSPQFLLTGHLGELLRGFAKKAWDPAATDDVGIVKLQSPFDPLDILTPDARRMLRDDLRQQFDHFRQNENVAAEDIPDIFYYRNRIPNWLGGLCQLRAFDTQFIMPLGARKFIDIAFQLGAADRKAEILHFLILRRIAPQLIALPFAQQEWSGYLQRVEPKLTPKQAITLPEGSTTLAHGDWQISFNKNPDLRKALSDLFRADPGNPVWSVVDREAMLSRLTGPNFSMHKLISLLGLLPSFFFAGRDVSVFSDEHVIVLCRECGHDFFEPRRVLDRGHFMCSLCQTRTAVFA